MTKANLAQVTNGTLGLLRALKHTFGIPRGLLAIFTITFLYIFPYEIVRILFSKNKLDILSRVTVRAIRYALGDGNVPKNRFIYGLLDQIYHFTTYMQGYTLTRNQSLIVKNTDVPSEIKGLWILDKNKSVPSFQSPEWDQKLVVFWIHGSYLIFLLYAPNFLINTSYRRWVL